MSLYQLVKYSLAAGAVLMLGVAAQAQTLEECEAGMEAITSYIPNHPDIPARETALYQMESANEAKEAGDYAECMLHVREAAGALSCAYGSANRLECG